MVVINDNEKILDILQNRSQKWLFALQHAFISSDKMEVNARFSVMCENQNEVLKQLNENSSFYGNNYSEYKLFRITRSHKFQKL